MKIRFIGAKNINVASNRLRMYLPIKFMQFMGYNADYVDGSQSDDIIYIIAKTNNHHIEYTKNKKFIWDVCDNYFAERPEKRKAAVELLSKCSGVITISESMKNIIQSEMNSLNIMKPIFIADDPSYYNFEKPKFNPSDVINLVWFGMFVNIDYGNWEKDVLKPLSKLPYKFNFTFISNRKVKPKNIEKYNFSYEMIDLNPYDMNLQRDIILKNDIITLCIDPDHPAVVGKSHNKLIDGLALGMPVVASPQRSYMKYSNYCFIQDNFASAIEYMIDNRDDVINRIKNGQNNIAQTLSPEVIGKQWISAIEEIYNGT